MMEINKHTAKLAQAAGSLSALALLPAGAQAGIIHHSTTVGPVTTSVNTTFWDVDTGSANNNGMDSNNAIKLSHPGPPREPRAGDGAA